VPITLGADLQVGVDQDRDTAVVIVSGELDATTAPTPRDRLARVDADREWCSTSAA